MIVPLHAIIEALMHECDVVYSIGRIDWWQWEDAIDEVGRLHLEAECYGFDRVY